MWLETIKKKQMKQVLYMLFVTVMLSCNNNKNKNEAPVAGSDSTAVVELTAEQIKKAGIVTDTLTYRTMHSRLQVNGMVDVPPQSMISVSFPLGGYLKATKLLPGLRIRKGEVLAVLEDPQFIQLQQDYLMAKAKLQFAEADYQRQKELNSTQASSEKALQMAESEYESNKVLVKALAQKLLLINIQPETLTENNISRQVNVYSPINGFVSKVNVNIGKYVSPTDVLFELVDPSDIHLNLTVFEKDAALLAIGQKVTAYSNDKPDEKHAADIFLISRNVNEDRAVTVHCHFDQYDPLLLPGMYMNAVIDVNNKNAIALPDAAIVRWQDKFYVFATTAALKFEMIPVTTGVSADGFTEVNFSPGVKTEGLRWVTVNAYTLLMKLKNSGEEE